MADVKPAEVSAILKNQLAGFESTASLDEVGTVLQVGDGIARVYGLTHAEYGELVTFENGMDGMVLNLEEDNVGVVLLGPVDKDPLLIDYKGKRVPRWNTKAFFRGFFKGLREGSS